MFDDASFDAGVIRGLKLARENVRDYARVSSLHNHGPGGLTKTEKELIIQAELIIQDLNVLIQLENEK